MKGCVKKMDGIKKKNNDELISKKDTIQEIKKTMEDKPEGYIASFYNNIKRRVINIISEMPPIEPKPDRDMIHLQKEQAYLAGFADGQRCSITDEDCISKQAVIKWVKTECNPYGNPTLDYESGIKIINYLKNMPPKFQ